MREIKFRGRRVNNSEFVYGDLVHMTGGRVGIIFDKRVAAVEVNPDTVAQLVGHDSHGNEVYEGDTLTDGSGNSYITVLEPCVDWKNDRTDSIFRRVPIKFAKKFTKLTLVEAE